MKSQKFGLSDFSSVAKTVSCLVFALFGMTSYGAVVPIPSGKTVTATDATVEAGYLFEDATGTLILDLSSAPTCSIEGAGTVVKDNEAAWTMETPITAFSGSYRINKGVVTVKVANVFGSSTTPKVYVANGAQLVFPNDTAYLKYQEIHIAGDGPDGTGALRFASGGSTGVYDYFMRSLVLDADARVVVTAGTKYLFESKFNLGGHTLRIGGKGTIVQMSKWSGEGDVFVEAGAGYSIRAEGAYSPTKSETSGYVLAGGTFNLVKKELKPVDRPVRLSGTGNKMTGEEWWDVSSPYNHTTNNFGWRGAITFTNEDGMTELTVSANAAKQQLNFLGPITGNGKVTVPKSNVARICFGSPANAFTGPLTISNEGAGSSVQALYPGSIPDYAQVTCDYGHLELPFLSADGLFGWPFKDVTNLMAQATWTNGAYPVLDGQYATAEERKFPAVVATLDQGICANCAVTMTNLVEIAGKSFKWYSGTAIFSEKVNLALESLMVNNATGTRATYENVVQSPCVILDGGITLEGGSTPWYVGKTNYDLVQTNVARLVVKNATLLNKTVSRIPAAAKNDALVIGGGGDWGEEPGILEVCAGAIVSNKLLVGGHDYGYGLVRQSGGKVISLGATSNMQYGPGLAMSSWASGKARGHYEMTDGEFLSYGSFYIGSYGLGTWHQTGGATRFTYYPGTSVYNMPVGIGMGNGGAGSLDLQGGTFTSDYSFEIGKAYNGTTVGSYVAVDGPTAKLSAKTISASINMDTARTAIAVRNGGCIKASSIYKGDKNNNTLAVSFDNGRYESAESWQYIFMDTSKTAKTRASAVIVRQGGMTLDTGDIAHQYLSAPLRPPYGGGIAEVPLATPLTGSGCVLPPFVDIEGDGLGAVVMPVWNADTATVTGFRIVDPGVGYTWAKAVLYKTANTKVATIDCVVNETVNAGKTGSFTKCGTSALEVECMNSWGGATIVKGGTLKAMCDWAIPDNSPVVLAGGDIDFNNKTGNVSKVTYGPGGGRLLNADNVALPQNFDMVISVEDILAGKPVVLQGDQNLNGKTVRVTGDFGALDPEVCRRYTVVRSTGRLLGTPNIVSEELPQNWKFKMTATELKLVHSYGIMLIVR